jgi:hypothetical protein
MRHLTAHFAVDNALLAQQLIGLIKKVSNVDPILFRSSCVLLPINLV